MSEEHIFPAINPQQEESIEMSAEEFQRRLYDWFEERGLLSNLRAHLRKQMISVLKDTNVGKIVSSRSKPISPKLQALNLLIAEFLLQQDYHYSLSVFSTEVPLINVLPEFPGLTVNCYKNNTSGTNLSSSKWQFSRKDAWDILETLGIHHNINAGEEVINNYYNDTNKEALLTCIVRMLHNFLCKSRSNLLITEPHDIIEKQSDTNIHCDLLTKKVKEILNSNNIFDETSKDIIKALKEVVDTEKKRLAQNYKEKYVKLQCALELEMRKREEEQQKRRLQLQKSLEVEQANWEAVKQKESEEFRRKFQHHKTVLRDRYQYLFSRERELNEREQQVRQKEMMVESQQQNLAFSYNTLYQEQQNITEIQDRLNQEMQGNAETSILKSINEEYGALINQVDLTQNVANKTVRKNGDSPIEQTMTRNLIRQLQAENNDLRHLTAEQRTTIQDLSQRAVHLMHDFGNIRPADVNHRLDRNGVLTAPPLTAPPHISRIEGNFWTGAGEEVLHRPSPLESPREYRHLFCLKDRKKLPPRRLTIHSSGSSEDHTPTNEVLIEARERLRRLEQEGEDVERQYRLFKSKHQLQADYYNYYKNNQSILGSYFNDKQRHGFNSQQENVPQLFLDDNCDEEPLEPQKIDMHSSDIQDPRYTASLKIKSPKKNPPESPQVIELHTPFKSDPNKEKHKSNPKEIDQESSARSDDESAIEMASVASSGVIGEMLAAATSGVSYSGLDTTNDKSESPAGNSNN